MEELYKYGHKTNEEIYNTLEKMKYSKEYEKVVEVLNTLIEKYPNNPECYLSRSDAFGLLNQYDKAIIDCTHAIKLYNKSAVSYESRGNAFLRSGCFYDAIDDFTTVIDTKELEHRDYYLLECYAFRTMAYCALGKWKEAREDIKFVEECFVIYTDPFRGKIDKARLVECVEKQIILR